VLLPLLNDYLNIAHRIISESDLSIWSTLADLMKPPRPNGKAYKLFVPRSENEPKLRLRPQIPGASDVLRLFPRIPTHGSLWQSLHETSCAYSRAFVRLVTANPSLLLWERPIGVQSAEEGGPGSNSSS
jgi:hypothetical protein